MLEKVAQPRRVPATGRPAACRSAVHTYAGRTALNRRACQLLALALTVGLLPACASMKEEKRANKLQEATQAYMSSLRWGYYDLASQMIANRESAPEPIDFDFLKKIHVTSYDTLNQFSNPALDSVQYWVQINYYHIDYGTVRSITDHQNWRYDEEAERWFLDGNLPDFKGGLSRSH